MKIDIMGTNIETPASGPPAGNGNVANFNVIPRRYALWSFYVSICRADFGS